MNLAKCLAEQFDLDLMSLRLTGAEDEVARRLTPPFRRITIVDPDNAGSFARRALYRGVYELRGLISGVPRAAFYESCQNVRRALLRLATQTAYDLVHLEYWTAGPLLEILLGAPHILYLHDAAFQTVRQTAELEANPLRRYALQRRAARLERFERRIISRASRVHFLSDADHSLFADVAGERGRTVPLLLPRPPRDAAVNEASRVVLFVGHMGHLPNRDGAGWLVKHVVPRVRRVVPVARFRFVGPGLALRTAAVAVRNWRRLPAIHGPTDAAKLMRLCQWNLAVLHLARQWKPDVIHSHWAFPAGSGGALAADELGIPLVMTLRGYEHMVAPQFGYGACLDLFYEQTLKDTLRSAARITVCCTDSVRRLRDLGVHDMAKVEHVFHAVDAARFSATDEQA